MSSDTKRYLPFSVNFNCVEGNKDIGCSNDYVNCLSQDVTPMRERFIMKTQSLLFVGVVCCLLFFALIISGCSDDDTPTNSADVWAWGELAGGANDNVWTSGVYDNKLVIAGSFDSCGSDGAS